MTNTLHEKMSTLSAVCSQKDWDEGTAKPIGQAQWTRALVIVTILQRELPHLPEPEPGADAEGFIWMTWDDGHSKVALELRDSLVGDAYQWTVTRDGIDKRWSANTLRDLVTSLRATWPAS